MRRLALVVALCALWGAASCEPSLSLDDVLEGRPCRAEGQRCLTGYLCVTEDNGSEICKRSQGGQAGQSGSGGEGGTDSAGGGGETSTSGTGGSKQGSGGSDVQGGAGGDAGMGGTLGQGGSDVPDAAAPGDGGCVPGPLYRDRDGDGYGSEAQGDVELGCELEGYVRVGGDCHDAVVVPNDPADLVHPGQTEYQYVTYPDPTKSDGRSYDFDCDDQETGAPNNNPPGGSPTCPPDILGGLNCVGQGYLEGSRVGPGENSLCGSETIVTCQVIALTQCEATYASVPGGLPYMCK
jgi:hypothetical protein